MKNGMTPLFDQQSLERWFDHFQNRAEERMLKLLQGAGEKFVGYVIAKDGEVLTENFQESDKGTDKITGKYKGHRLAKEVSLSHTGGYVLVGVAGMEYAAAVEAKGYEVVSGANTQCEKYLRDTLKLFFSNM